ncbi:immunoglobulin superfamily member 6 [Rhinatrema bivittatum]|uniref:immunoglobulin superfamily member 6 n=1 Tax=Rhinatrema bivittatum TaxID=194408 RepID=UPI0011289625|nr:immunoglobulin superfamily member 6 [Rhinatrema bivittatum]
MAPLSHLNCLWRTILILVLCGAGSVTPSCKVSVKQDPLLRVNSTSPTATILCNFSAIECPPSFQVFWFRYLAIQPEGLCVPNCDASGKFISKLEPQGSSLEIRGLHSKDSGLYICGVAFRDSSSTSKRTGQGTTLVVGEPQAYLGTENILLIVLTLLLFVYCTATLSVFLYLYRSKSKELKHREGRQTPEEPEKNRRGRTIFRAIAQELYIRRHDHIRHQSGNPIVDDNIYQNS